MNIKKSVFEKDYVLKVDGISYYPNFTFTKFENDEYVGVIITETAEQIYKKRIAEQENDSIVTTKQEILNAQLLQQNAKMCIELEQQKQLNAQILLQLAGGNTNV